MVKARLTLVHPNGKKVAGAVVIMKSDTYDNYLEGIVMLSYLQFKMPDGSIKRGGCLFETLNKEFNDAEEEAEFNKMTEKPTREQIDLKWLTDKEEEKPVVKTPKNNFL